MTDGVYRRFRASPVLDDHYDEILTETTGGILLDSIERFDRARSFGPLRAELLDRVAPRSTLRYSPGEIPLLDRFAARLARSFLFGMPYGGLINRDVALPYHRDRTNPRRSWNATVVFRRAAGGGRLIFPGLRRAVACDDEQIVVFDGQELVHGVSPIDVESPDGYRISVVFYVPVD